MSPELQISRAEAQKFSAGQSVFAFWSDLLAKRAQDFVAGGAARRGALRSHAGPRSSRARNSAGLVRQQGKVNQQFGGFLGATGLLGGKGSLKPDLYWELLEVEDEGVLTLGASYTRAHRRRRHQVADGLYYASGGYNVALTLYQLWPVEVGGRASTLVWRGDFISAQFVRRTARDRAARLGIGHAKRYFEGGHDLSARSWPMNSRTFLLARPGLQRAHRSRSSPATARKSVHAPTDAVVEEPFRFSAEFTIEQAYIGGADVQRANLRRQRFRRVLFQPRLRLHPAESNSASSASARSGSVTPLAFPTRRSAIA